MTSSDLSHFFGFSPAAVTRAVTPSRGSGQSGQQPGPECPPTTPLQWLGWELSPPPPHMAGDGIGAVPLQWWGLWVTFPTVPWAVTHILLSQKWKTPIKSEILSPPSLSRAELCHTVQCFVLRGLQAKKLWRSSEINSTYPFSTLAKHNMELAILLHSIQDSVSVCSQYQIIQRKEKDTP